MDKLALLGIALFAALPATTTYKLNSYSFGSGGTANSSTTTYALEGSAGQLSGAPGATITYGGKGGFIETQQANVPKLSALDNNSGQYYNRLHFTIDSQNNPTDAKYLISVSSDNFVADTKYLQTDGTLSTSLLLTDYQNYGYWGGASGSLIIGLNPSTTYYVKLKATQGLKTESAYGPVSSATTSTASITFSLNTSSHPSPPYSVDIGTLLAGNINTTPDTVNTTLTTNGSSGANVYVSGQNGGLKSTSTSYLISSSSTDLSSASEGFGAQNSSITQTSGGPYTVVAPYSGSANNVGIVSSTLRSLYTSSAAVTGGTGTFVMKAKSSASAKTAADYNEVLTLIAAGNF